MLARLSVLLSAALLAACATAPSSSNPSDLDSQCAGFGYVQGATDFMNCTHMLDLLSGHP